MCKKLIFFVLLLALCITSLVQAGNIIWVSDFFDDNDDGDPDDHEWVNLLRAAGHTVDYTPGWEDLDDAKITALNAADLVIISRCSNSGQYDDGDEPTQWNSITRPMIVSSTHLMRSSRWKLLDHTLIWNLAPADMVLADGSTISGIDGTVGPSSFIVTAPGNGTVLATIGDGLGLGLPWIIEWEAGVEYYDGAGQTAGGPRMFFAAGTLESGDEVIGRGEMNLTDECLAFFMGAVDTLLADNTPEMKLFDLATFIVDSGNIALELKGSLLVKIDATLAALDKGNPNDAKVAMNDLKALINQVEAQEDKKITLEAAAEIIQRTNAIIAHLGG